MPAAQSGALMVSLATLRQRENARLPSLRRVRRLAAVPVVHVLAGEKMVSKWMSAVRNTLASLFAVLWPPPPSTHLRRNDCIEHAGQPKAEADEPVARLRHRGKDTCNGAGQLRKDNDRR